MNTPSQSPFLCRCLRTLRVLAGFSIFGLLYASCELLSESGKEANRTAREGFESTLNQAKEAAVDAKANQASALSQGGLSGVGQVCAPYH